MAKYTDDEIRAMPKITAKIAADYLGISPMMVTLGMRNDVLPIGFAVKKEDRYSTSWSYNIIAERLIAYNHGRINEVQIQNIEKSLNTIISQFEEMKRDLVFLLLNMLICNFLKGDILISLPCGFMLTTDGSVSINQEKAHTVSTIYQQYLSAMRLKGIADFLFAQGIPSPRSNTHGHDL